MIHFTRPLSDLRKTEGVTLRKDASRQYGNPETQVSVERPAVVRVGEEAKARLGRTEGSGETESRAREFSVQAPQSRPAPAPELLERAVRAFGAEKEAREQGLRSVQLPLIERADQAVPYDVLQRAAAAQDVEPRPGEEETKPLPFTDDAPLLASTDSPLLSSLGNPRTSFELPEKVGEPYGRDVPFDLTEEELTADAPAVERSAFRSGSADPSNSSPVDSALGNGAVTKQVDGTPKGPISAELDKELDLEAQLTRLVEEVDRRDRAESPTASRSLAQPAAPSEGPAESGLLVSRTKRELASEAYRAAQRELEGQRAVAVASAAAGPSVPLQPGFELTA